MNYLLFGAILTLLIFIFIYLLNKRKSRKQIEQIRAAWGNSKTEFFNFDGIKNYSEEVKGNNFHHLTEQTINDIDFMDFLNLSIVPQVKSDNSFYIGK